MDLLAAALAFRLRVREQAGRAAKPVLKTTDLKKAYKQLGVSTDALKDNFLAVENPATGLREVYGCTVLPFGACAAVAAFLPYLDGHLACGMLTAALPLECVLR